MRSFHHRDYFFHPCRHRTYECRRCGHVDLFGVGPDDSGPWKVIGSTDAQPM